MSDAPTYRDRMPEPEAGQEHVLAEFRPDLVFQIDHLRSEQAGVFPPELPFVCWVQDNLPFNRTDSEVPLSYGDVFLQNEREQSAYNFEHADTDMLFRHFADAEKECGRKLRVLRTDNGLEFCERAMLTWTQGA